MNHVEIMRVVQSNLFTHDCPECGNKAYCAMEAGKSASLCWCMTVEKKVEVAGAEACLCKKCLERD